MRATPKTWINRCIKNIEEFQFTREVMSIEEQKAFIREQYEVLAVLKKVIRGQALIRGVDHIPRG